MLEDKLDGYCPNCGEKTEFEYIGLQIYNLTAYKMYNCLLCIDTLSESTIKEYSKKRKEIEELK